MKHRPKIVYLDAGIADYGDLDFQNIYKLGKLTCYDTTKPSQIQSHLGDAEIAILNKFIVDKTTVAAFKNVRLICISATGHDNVDVALAKKHDIWVSNVVNYCTDSVAEHTLMLMLALSHRLRENDLACHEKIWCQSTYNTLNLFPYRELKGKTLGIVGYGRIGQKVAKLAKSFGMKIAIAALPGRKYSAKDRRLPLKNVFQTSDFITLHCPLTPLTQSLINVKTLAWINPSTALLNLSRGKLVNEMDLAMALRKNRLKAFATDVLSIEPPLPSNPLLAKDLQKKIIITPHVAWASLEARQRLIDDIAKTISTFLGGKKRSILP